MATSAIIALANITLGSSQATVTFSSIPATYRDLRIIVNGLSSSLANMQGRINGDTGANYNDVHMTGDGSSVYSNQNSTQTSLNYMGYSTMSSTTYSTVIIEMMDYSAIDHHKTLLVRQNNTQTGAEASALRWTSTSAVTSFSLYFAGDTFSSGTTFSLYGIVS